LNIFGRKNEQVPTTVESPTEEKHSLEYQIIKVSRGYIGMITSESYDNWRYVDRSADIWLTMYNAANWAASSIDEAERATKKVIEQYFEKKNIHSTSQVVKVGTHP
jgi:hypothetical protein